MWEIPLFQATWIDVRAEPIDGVRFSQIRARYRYPGFRDRHLGDAKRVPLGADGKARLGPVPFVPGAPILIDATKLNGVRGNLPVAWQPTWTAPLLSDGEEFFGPDPSPVTYGVGGLGSMPYGELPPDGCGSAVVQCTDRHGRPVRGALVLRNARRDKHDWSTIADAAFSDARGQAVFPMVEPGESTFLLAAEGVCRQVAKANVLTDRETRVDLREPKPGRVDLRVTRAEGGPAAWAEIVVERYDGRRWHDVRDGVCYVQPRTGHDGTRTLYNVDAGNVRISVWWFRRSASEVVSVEREATTKVEFVLSNPSGTWAPGK